MTTHSCFWPKCQAQVPIERYGCKIHWYALPLAMRDDINRAWHGGNHQATRELVEAQKRAQEWAHKQVGTELDLHARADDPDTSHQEMKRKSEGSLTIAAAVEKYLLAFSDGITERELSEMIVRDGLAADRTSVTPCIAPMIRRGDILRPGTKRDRSLLLFHPARQASGWKKMTGNLMVKGNHRITATMMPSHRWRYYLWEGPRLIDTVEGFENLEKLKGMA